MDENVHLIVNKNLKSFVVNTSNYDRILNRKALGDISNLITAQSQNTVLNQKTETIKVVQSETVPKEMSTKRDQQVALNKSSKIDVSEDIDEFDSHDPQMFSKCANEMYPHLKKLEKQLETAVRQPP